MDTDLDHELTAPIFTVPWQALEWPALGDIRRRQPADIETLAKSIELIGLINPLTVTPGSGPGMWSVVAGMRRYRALRALYEQQQLDGVVIDAVDFERIPVRQLAADVDLTEVALTENVERLDMDPFDEADTYARLPDSDEELAARYGIPVKRVRQRRALANVIDSCRKLYADGTLSLGGAQALSDLPMEMQQRFAGFIEERPGHPGITAAEVKSILGLKKIPAKHAIFPLDNVPVEYPLFLFNGDGDDGLIDAPLYFQRTREHIVNVLLDQLRAEAEGVHVIVYEEWFWHDSHKYEKTRKKKNTTTLVHVRPDGEVKIERQLTLRNKPSAALDDDDYGDDREEGEAPTTATEPKPAGKISKPAHMQILDDHTEYVRAHIAGAVDKDVHAVLVLTLAMLATRGMGIQRNVPQLGRVDEQTIIELHETLPETENARNFGLLSCRPLSPNNFAKTVADLDQMGTEDLLGMLAMTVAYTFCPSGNCENQIGGQPYRPEDGYEPLHAVARLFEVECPAVSKENLQGLQKPTLEAMLPEGVSAKPKKAELIEQILQAQARGDAIRVPPFLRWDSPAD